MDLKSWLTAYENYNIFKAFDEARKTDREVIFLCVGNGKIWFDSFGPMMGSLLKRCQLKKFIYGNLQYSIKGSNIKEFIEMIAKFHINPFIIVFDSCLSKSCGLTIKKGPLLCSFLSEGVEVGDLSVSFNMTKEFINDPRNFKKLLSEVKRVARYIVYCFKEKTQFA